MSNDSDVFKLPRSTTLRRTPTMFQKETPLVIQQFLKSYKRNHWRTVASVVKQALEEKFHSSNGDVLSEGVQALVIYRAKTKESLEEKLKWRHEQNPYKDVKDIETQIKDFAGVRVILIIPSQSQFKKVDDIVKELFGPDLNRKEHGKKLQEPEVVQEPEVASQPDGRSGTYQPMHLGYQGVHYRPKLQPKHGKFNTYDFEEGDKVEIQVTSALGHAWAEAGHDILYKGYLYGKASMREEIIYDALNGLVTSGNLLLQELHGLVMQRSFMRFEDPYQLESYLGTLDVLQGNDIPTLANLLPRESSEVLLRVLQKTKKNYPLAIRNALIKLGYPDGEQGERELANFRPSFNPSDATKFVICLVQHFLPNDYLSFRSTTVPSVSDAASRCRLMMSALCFLQYVLGSRYKKGHVGHFLFQVGVSAEAEEALNWMVKSKDRYILLKDVVEWECEEIEKKTSYAWPWFKTQAMNPRSICGLCFKLAYIGAIKPFELRQSLYELDNMGVVSRSSTGDTVVDTECDRPD